MPADNRSSDNAIQDAIKRSQERKAGFSSWSDSNRKKTDSAVPLSGPPSARKRGAEPDMVEMPKRERGADPDLVEMPKKKRGADPDLVEMPKKQRGADPDLVEMPKKQRGAEPDLLETLGNRQGANAELIEMPKRRKGAEPDLVEAASVGTRPPSAQAVSPAAAPIEDGKIEDDIHAIATAAVATLVERLADVASRQGDRYAVEQTGDLAITMKSGTRRLTLQFQPHEVLFDRIEIYQTLSVPRQYRRRGLIAAIRRLFGRETTVTRIQRQRRRLSGRSRQSCGRDFGWGSDAANDDDSPGTLALTAEFLDRRQQHRIGLRLSGESPDSTPVPLSSQGATRAVNALFAGLHTVLSP